ncbi:MAG: carboxylating nicotinate-nucleotide diphosphorylase [Candidatus Bathyarchaeia archaeon]
MRRKDVETEKLILATLEEDRCDEDVTTKAIIPHGLRIRGAIYVKAEGVVAGIEVAQKVFTHGGSAVTFTPLVKDGDSVTPGQKIAEINGDAHAILSRERVALNFLQHLSGVATATREYVKRAGGVKILDTRKTTPGLRELEKSAVKAGGGHNHRLSLAEMVLIKDNHLAIVGSIAEAVRRARGQTHLKVEVETKTISEVRKALQAKPDRIMLDNMSLAEMKEAIEMIRSSGLPVEIEVSGGVTLGTVRQIAELEPDYISVGALTHSAKALDMSLEVE